MMLSVFSEALMKTDTVLIQGKVGLKSRGLKEKKQSRKWFDGRCEESLQYAIGFWFFRDSDPLLQGFGYFACKQNISSSTEGANMVCIAFLTYYSCHGSHSLPPLQSLYLFLFTISLHLGCSLALP